MFRTSHRNENVCRLGNLRTALHLSRRNSVSGPGESYYKPHETSRHMVLGSSARAIISPPGIRIQRLYKIREQAKAITSRTHADSASKRANFSAAARITKLFGFVILARTGTLRHCTSATGISEPPSLAVLRKSVSLSGRKASGWVARPIPRSIDTAEPPHCPTGGILRPHDRMIMRRVIVFLRALLGRDLRAIIYRRMDFCWLRLSPQSYKFPPVACHLLSAAISFAGIFY